MRLMKHSKVAIGALVALAMHFRSLCTGGRTFYTAPIKALVSEKFFDLSS